MRSFIAQQDPSVLWLDNGAGTTFNNIKMGKSLEAQRKSWLSVKATADEALKRIDELEKAQ